MQTSVLFLHSSSFLIRYGEELLLTDPLIWPGPKHLSYLSLMKNLNILITHEKENYFSTDLFKIFHPETTFIVGYVNFTKVSLKLRSLGFRRIIQGDDFGLDLGNFHVKIFERPCKDREWISYSVRTKTGIVVYTNDAYYPVRTNFATTMKLELLKVPGNNAMVISGWDLNLSLSQFLQLRRNVEGMGIKKVMVHERPEFLHLIEKSEIEVMICEWGEEVVFV